MITKAMQENTSPTMKKLENLLEKFSNEQITLNQVWESLESYIEDKPVVWAPVRGFISAMPIHE